MNYQEKKLVVHSEMIKIKPEDIRERLKDEILYGIIDTGIKTFIEEVGRRGIEDFAGQELIERVATAFIFYENGMKAIKRKELLEEIEK